MLEFIIISLTRLLTGAIPRSHGFQFEPVAQRIYYANHSSHLDTLLIWSLIPRLQRAKVRPAAAKDYWWSSSWRRYLAENIFHAVPVLRHRMHADDNPLADLEAALANGDSLIFFPEGTRGNGDAVQPFKSGLYYLVKACPNVSVVPVYIRNLNRVLPKGALLPVPLLCNVEFGAEFKMAENEPKADFIARAQTKLEALIPE